MEKQVLLYFIFFGWPPNKCISANNTLQTLFAFPEVSDNFNTYKSSASPKQPPFTNQWNSFSPLERSHYIALQGQELAKQTRMTLFNIDSPASASQ